MCVLVSAVYDCRGQRTVSWNWFSSSTFMWAQNIRLAWQALSITTILPSLTNTFLLLNYLKTSLLQMFYFKISICVIKNSSILENYQNSCVHFNQFPFLCLQSLQRKPGVVMHTFNPSTKGEEGSSL